MQYKNGSKCVEHPISPEDRHSLVPIPNHVKKNAWVDVNETILPGITIGENWIITADAVVFRDVPGNANVGGVPAKIIKSII